MTALTGSSSSAALKQSAESQPRGVLRTRLRHWRTRIAPAKKKSPQLKRNLSAILREWHKRVGLFAFVFMGWLGASGFLINQSADWGYDTVRIDWGWVMALYGLHPEPPQTGFAAGDHWLAVTADYTLLDALPLSQPIAAPLGFVAGGPADAPLLFVAASDRLVLLMPSGDKVDELVPPILPVSTIRRVGSIENVPGAIAVQDLDAYQSHDGGDTWTTVDPGSVRWSQSEPMPQIERDKLMPYSRPSVSLEHVLVDAHSGRLFGQWGVYVINAVGFAALALSITGVWMIWRTSRQRRRNAAAAAR